MKLLLLLATILLSLAAFPQEVIVDAKPLLNFKNPPFVLNDTTYVPLRETADALGIGVEKALSFVDAKSAIRLNKKGGGTITFVPARMIAKGLALDIIRNDNSLTIGTTTWKVEGKLIVIDRGRQRVYAFKGLKRVYDCQTCTGDSKHVTPTGIFAIYRKWPGWHSWKATEEVPYSGKMYNSMYFQRPRRALHGSDADMILKIASSHGCGRLFCKDADWLFAWVPGIPDPKNDWLIPEKDYTPVYVVS